MGDSGSGARAGPGGGPEDARPDDLCHFISVDLQIFERLNCGDPRPFRLTLRDGRQITGEPTGIARGTGFAEEVASFPWGRVLMTTADGIVELDYLEIAEVA
jgi:hypothetical protein